MTRKIRLTRPTSSEYIAVTSETMPVDKPYRFQGPLVIEGDFVIEEVDDNRYVAVEFLGARGVSFKRYTYIDPSGTLRIGDLVEAPTSNSTRPQVARVVEVDVPPYGTGVKSVAWLLERVAL